MQIIDLHIHSRYSRACSQALTLPNIDKTCRVKGVDVIATGDFTHPAWFSHIKEQLEEVQIPLLDKEGMKRGSLGSGLYKLKTATDDKVRFILSTEVALIYKDAGKVRRIHLVVMAPHLKAAKELNGILGARFNIKSDGRPILGMKAPELVKICLSIDPKFLIFPAHIWTPWFSVFGSKSGFDSLEECFHEETKNIFAYETGLSSDPEMNWRVSGLDRLTLLSNSDAHSLRNIAREANVFDLEEISYGEIRQAIKKKDQEKLKYSIEFYPEEGMYHFDGHRSCGIVLSPEETKKMKGICPVCRKPLTIGVLNRVEELADRPEGCQPAKAPGSKKLVELDKIIAEALDIKSRNSQKVRRAYDDLIGNLGSEMHILLRASLDDIGKASFPAIAEGVRRVREGELDIKPGFDGQYGEVRIFSEAEKIKNKQQRLF